MPVQKQILVVCALAFVLQCLAQQPLFCVINTGSCLRIRSEASVSGRSLICVRDGTKLEDLNSQITASGIVWRNVRYQSHVGWASKQFLKACGTSPSPPIGDVTGTRPLTLLPFPTPHAVTHLYGDTRTARASPDQFRSSQGMNPAIEFAADEDEVVTASCGGQVVHAGSNSPFAAGPVSVIVRCGPWYVVYGRLKSTAVKKGDQAYLGQIVGRAGRSGLYFQIRQVPSNLLSDTDPNHHPGDARTAVNPLTVFATDLNGFFVSEFNRLGGKPHFCTGDLSSQGQISFGGPIREDKCTN